MTTFKITATAPTSYQLNSLTRFRLSEGGKSGGAFYGWQYFTTEEEAKDYLTNIAENHYENENELKEALADIDNGVLTIDAVTAYIEEEEYFVIGIFAGRSEEYWVGQCGRLCDREYEAQKFDSIEDANETLEEIVKPLAVAEGWDNCDFKII